MSSFVNVYDRKTGGKVTIEEIEFFEPNIPRNSGRYPWENKEKFISKVKELKEKGLTKREIAEAFEMLLNMFCKKWSLITRPMIDTTDPRVKKRKMICVHLTDGCILMR